MAIDYEMDRNKQYNSIICRAKFPLKKMLVICKEIESVISKNREKNEIEDWMSRNHD